MTRLLFSLPVHEKPDIVRDQIDNINYFAPGSQIIIHIAQLAAGQRDEFLRHCDVENVTFNPESLETVWSGGILHTHISNFEHAQAIDLPFDRIVLISSNELLVKEGIGAYMDTCLIGAQTEVYEDSADWGVFREAHLQLPGMQRFLAKLNLPLFFGGQAEGQFFPKNIFQILSNTYRECFPMGPIGFPIEEVVPATVAARFAFTGVDVVPPITFCDYCTNLEIGPDFVEQIRRGNGSIFARKVPRALQSPHVNKSVLKSVFSVKRVPREDCDLRRYIRGLMQ
ncbi:hypothetical protein [Rhizobium sp. SSA_523]|uniref:hypothetical protein n=1 Tax=Rhizobium sp. SSA_523 TaxID=2952477 RepID=UPI0020908C95|nr:hypothetical protein [Rhizobium sp. SSA_523]MCO5731899.1 hypothetical protein [Rhizobium sp. SSA_523]WKC22745.1 hypothetical protein QTJ18_18035 [Rhizobium sp. SSA_523]